MSDSGTPPPSLTEYAKALPVLRLVRVMERFLDEVVDTNPEMRSLYRDVRRAYTAILQDELAPHAMVLAFAVIELEAYCPDIARRAAAS
jgi:hypothetical protein